MQQESGISLECLDSFYHELNQYLPAFDSAIVTKMQKEYLKKMLRNSFKRLFSNSFLKTLDFVKPKIYE